MKVITLRKALFIYLFIYSLDYEGTNVPEMSFQEKHFSVHIENKANN